jgi:hypothetical protein
MFQTTLPPAPTACRRFLLVACMLGVAAGVLQAQPPVQPAPAVLVGRTVDPAGQPVTSVLVSVFPEQGERPLRSALSRADGAFRIDALPPARYRIRTDRLGYRTTEQRIELNAGETRRLELQLPIETVEVEGVVARAERDRQRERARFETEAGVTARVIDAQEIRLLPGLAEPDVLRAIEVLPGVVSTSDFSSSFNVRGGSADQNLILIDGFPIFNPFHLAGLFSVLNSDALARAELFAGGFGAEYGGRVSSVLTVESRSGGEPGWHFDGGVSVLASRLTARGVLDADRPNPLGGTGGSFLVAGRRSYFDYLLRPVVAFPYHLTDLQSHGEIGLRGGGRLRATGYWGEDVLDLSEFQPPGNADTVSILRVRWDWGNTVLGLRWDQPVGRWLAETRLGYSGFGTSLEFADFGDTRFSSEISQLMLRSDLGGDLSPAWTLRGGVEAARMRYENMVEAGGTVFNESRDDGILASSYLQTRWRPDQRWIVEAGVRGDGWFSRAASYGTLSPRFAVKRFLDADGEWAAKLAVGRYVQFLHSLRDEELPFSIDTWVLANEYVPPVVSDQIQLGLETFRDSGWSGSVEVYHRWFDGVTEFNFASDPNDPADELLVGRGTSYGLDVLLRRTQGRLTGWSTVSLLRATRVLPDPYAAVLDDELPALRFAPAWDRRVDLDFVLQYDVGRRTDAGLRWNFGSGLPYTRPIAQYFAWQHDVRYGTQRPSRFGRRGEEPALFVVLGPRNAERYPAYHRLDLTVRHTLERRWGTMTPYLQILNVYNQMNPLFYFYNFNSTPPTRSGISMFPVLPALGVEVSF